MLGILIQFALSYLIIYWKERGNLSFMGLKLTKQRALFFLLFFILAGLCSSIHFLLRMYFADERWMINPSLNVNIILNGCWYNLKSVLYEELIFRGVIFYLLIKSLGNKKAILISAAAFGIYHWFSYEVLNKPVQMLFIFLITGMAGVIYGYAYIKTKSLYTPIALHLGWNLFNAFVFSNGNIGSGILIEKLPAPQVQVSYFAYYLVTFLHLIAFYISGYLSLKNVKANC